MFCISRCSPLQTLEFAVAESTSTLPDGTVVASSRSIPSFAGLWDLLSRGNTGKNSRGVQRGAVGQAGSEEEPPTPGNKNPDSSTLSTIGILGGCW